MSNKDLGYANYSDMYLHRVERKKAPSKHQGIL